MIYYILHLIRYTAEMFLDLMCDLKNYLSDEKFIF